MHCDSSKSTIHTLTMHIQIRSLSPVNCTRLMESLSSLLCCVLLCLSFFSFSHDSREILLCFKFTEPSNFPIIHTYYKVCFQARLNKINGFFASPTIHFRSKVYCVIRCRLNSVSPFQ